MIEYWLMFTGSIIDQLATDIPPNGFTARNIDLMSLLLTSRGIHSATLSTLYAQVTIPHSRIFRKFLSHISSHPALGTIVRRLDFSHFNPTGAGMTARERAQTQNLIPETLLESLRLTTNLQEFLAQEHIDDELSPAVLKTLLCDLPKLKALDLCACSSTSFRDSFNSIISAQILPATLPIARLSLHECTILPSSVFDNLLPRLPRLTHLDVAHTRITDAALHSIPHTACLTHLNLSKCSLLSGASVVNFLTTHPAAKSLVYLNLAMDVKSAEMLSSDDITSLLPCLPTSLRSLNLKGSKMGKEHIELLLPITKHVEELGLGRHLDLRELTRLFVPDSNLPLAEQVAWIPHSLRYVDVSDLSIAQMDLGTLFGSSCPVLKTVAEPLDVLEVSAEVLKRLEKAPDVKRVGWCVKEAGRRGWLVRLPREGGIKDEGGRSWKWGATYWGMRKVPVARAEVGGIYGKFKFYTHSGRGVLILRRTLYVQEELNPRSYSQLGLYYIERSPAGFDDRDGGIDATEAAAPIATYIILPTSFCRGSCIIISFGESYGVSPPWFHFSPIPGLSFGVGHSRKRITHTGNSIAFRIDIRLEFEHWNSQA